MSSFVRASLRIYDWLARRIAPGSGPTQRSYYEGLRHAVRPNCQWLDLGCGHQFFPGWLNADEAELAARARQAVGIDLDFPSLKRNTVLRDRVLGNLGQLPFPSGAFDLVTANMVVEHVQDPGRLLQEVQRVLRPGGRFFFHTPNRRSPAVRVAARTPQWLKKWLIRILERRAEEDIFPTHYRLNTSGEIRRLAAQAGLRIEHMEHLNNAAVTAILGPLAIPELFVIRVLHCERLRDFRSNLLVSLQK